MRNALSNTMRQPTEDNADSSFELDEAHESPELPAKQLTTATMTPSNSNRNSTSTTMITTNFTAHIKDESDTGEQTDTQSTHSSSSTPTTADVADVETITSLPLSPTIYGRSGQLIKRHASAQQQQQKQQLVQHTPQQQQHQTNLVDNLSASIATNASEMPDQDNVPTVSVQQSSRCIEANAATSPAFLLQSSRYAATHPSAAFAETTVMPATSSASRSNPGTHRRTLSAASYISMRSQLGGAGSGAVPPDGPQQNRFFEWLRVLCKCCGCKVCWCPYGKSIVTYFV